MWHSGDKAVKEAVSSIFALLHIVNIVSFSRQILFQSHKNVTFLAATYGKCSHAHTLSFLVIF